MQKFKEFPKGKIRNVEGNCILLKGDDIDTDRIIPARYLKCVNFESLGNQVFADDREEKNGLHPFDENKNQQSSILVVFRNFGCGSSREHAPQALMRWGIRAIVGLSFAEIFYGNCLSLGIPCVKMIEKNLVELEELINNSEQLRCNLDLNNERLISNEKSWPIIISKGSSQILLSGQWDATSSLIAANKEINRVKSNLPYLNEFKIET